MPSDLSFHRLRRAASFLRGASGKPSEAAMHCAAVSLELSLKAVLHSRGWTDDRTRLEIRHDLRRALEEAQALGFPADRVLMRAIEKLGRAYATHSLCGLRDKVTPAEWRRMRRTAQKLHSRAHAFIEGCAG